MTSPDGCAHEQAMADRPAVRPVDAGFLLEEAFAVGTTREFLDALKAAITETLMVREGEVLTLDVARERAANLAQLLSLTVIRR